MPSREPDNLFRLASFAESVLLPAARLRGNPTSWDHGRALEAFLWLDLGVKIGAFAEEPARVLARSVGSVLETAIGTLDSSGLIPDYVMQIARRSFDGGEYFVKDRGSYVDSSALVPVFETLLYCAAEHGRTRHAEDMFSMLSQASDDRWEAMANEAVAPYLISRREEDFSNAAHLVEAFTAAVGYWMSTDELLQAVLRDDLADSSSRIALVGDASAIQIWKFNVGVARVRDRVHRAARMALAALPEMQPGIIVDALGADLSADLGEQLDGLMDRWQSRMEYAVGSFVA